MAEKNKFQIEVMVTMEKSGILIDREHIKKTFAEYTAQYDMDDEKIRLKVEHTYRVALLCERIACSLSLTEEEIAVAWTLGMLHDVGRFEQLRRFGTFSDADSIDHAHFGATLLFAEGRIRDYLPGEKWDEVLQVAIYYHSAYRLPENLEERTALFCKIIRDGDKIDILKVTCDIPLESIYDVSSHELYHATITPAVMEAFLEHHAILRSLKKTPLDNVVGHIALVFELEFPESYRLVQEQGYLDKLLCFPTQNPQAQRQMEQIRQCMESYLQQREEGREASS